MTDEKKILCHHSGQSYECKVIYEITPDLMLAMDRDWAEEKKKIFDELLMSCPDALHDSQVFISKLREYNLEDIKWSWFNKALALNGDEYKWFLLMADNKIQAASIIFHPKPSKFDSENVFYIDYLATAYWNRSRANYQKRFSGLGSWLIEHAVHYSINVLRYRPGFCLHSLPNAESFYTRLGMTDFGPDPGKQNLRFFEASRESTMQLYGGGKK
jgi:hypothetical protein